MEIRDFISAALVQIGLGIKDANEKLLPATNNQCRVNPSWMYRDHAGDFVVMTGPNGDTKPIAHLVDFDIAVEVSGSEEDSSNGGAKVKVAGVFSFGGGGDSKASESRSTVSRLKFSVPMTFPLAGC